MPSLPRHVPDPVRTHLPRSALSTVAHHLTDKCRASPDGGQASVAPSPDKFLYVFKPGPTGPGKRAATAGPGSGATFGSSPEGSSAPPPLAWGARANRVPGRRQQNSQSTIDTLSI